MNKSLRAFFVIALSTLSLGVLVSSSPTPFRDMIEEIAADAGKVLVAEEGDRERVIVVFEEIHGSVPVQLEIAIMLNRLYANYGMHHIGLEALTTEESSLDLSWAHRPPPYRPDQPITSREDVIVQTLIEGEIGGVEMMGLIYEDVVVHGIDDADLYAVEVSPAVWGAPYSYLYNIAIARMSKAQATRWKELYDQGEYQAAFEYAMTADRFTVEKHARLADTIDVASDVERLEMLDKLEATAKLFNVKLPPMAEAHLRSLRSYLEVFAQRTDAMVANTLNLAAANPRVPVGINIGGMHTDRVVELLSAAGVSFAVLRTQAQAAGSTAGLLSTEALRRKVDGLSVAPDWALGGLVDGRRKPAPVAHDWWYRAQHFMREFMQHLAESAAVQWIAGKSSEEIHVSLEASQGASFEPLSFEELLARHDIINATILDVFPPRPSNPNPTVDARFNFTDPATGAEKTIDGTAWVTEGQETKASVVLDERLSAVMERFVSSEKEHEPIAAEEPESIPEPQKVCSNTVGIFTTVEPAR